MRRVKKTALKQLKAQHKATIAAARDQKVVSGHDHAFVFEALEPRLLLSGGLTIAADGAIIAGLKQLNADLNALDSSSALNANAPFLNVSLDSLGHLGDPSGGQGPLTAIINAAQSYFNSTTTGSGATATTTATINGLASAISAINANPATVNGTQTTQLAIASANAATSGNVETIALSATQTTTNSATSVFDLSASGSGNTLSNANLNLTQKTTENLALTFGIDLTNAASPAFQLTSGATVGVTSDLSSTNLSASPSMTATVNGTQQTLAGGTADIHTVVTAAFNSPGGTAWTTASLTPS